jgi:hypothetical protein
VLGTLIIAVTVIIVITYTDFDMQFVIMLSKLAKTPKEPSLASTKGTSRTVLQKTAKTFKHYGMTPLDTVYHITYYNMCFIYVYYTQH